jgi:hypothetical protein
MSRLASHTSKDPIGKHATTEYNRFLRVRTLLNSAYADARCFYLPQSEVLAQTSHMYASADYRKLSSYYKGKIAGIAECLFSALYSCYGDCKPLLMHINTGTDGRVFPEFSDGWLNESAEYKSSMVCEHIWSAPYLKDGTVRKW